MLVKTLHMKTYFSSNICFANMIKKYGVFEYLGYIFKGKSLKNWGCYLIICVIHYSEDTVEDEELSIRPSNVTACNAGTNPGFSLKFRVAGFRE